MQTKKKPEEEQQKRPDASGRGSGRQPVPEQDRKGMPYGTGTERSGMERPGMERPGMENPWERQGMKGSGMEDSDRQKPEAAPSMDVMVAAEKPAIGVDEIRKARETLRKYKRGKQNLEDRIVKNERWFKMRHWDLIKTPETADDPKPASGWLFNTIISKHADFMDSFPKANILPREEGDKAEAESLSSIIPVVLQQNDFEEVYDDECWEKLKHGTGVYGVFWDPNKLNGLGDITISSLSLLNVFWEPGIDDIQKSRNFFYVDLIDNESLIDQYPQLQGKLKDDNDNTVKKYWYDESIDTTGKSAVIDWYYKKNINGKQTVQFCKFVNEEILVSTENDTSVEMTARAEGVYDQNGQPIIRNNGQYAVDIVEQPKAPSFHDRGLYDHGKYPFIFDRLFPEEKGIPYGFGFVDVCKNSQTSIDVFNNAFEKNVEFLASPRYFIRADGSVNADDFSDPHKLLIPVDGNLGSDSITPVTTPTMINSNYIAILNNKINEMKETAGNRDTSNGGSTSGVTAASAIAAMQEQSGKTSRDQIKTSYRAYEKLVTMVIELIRQFYDMPRQFRITGQQGEEQFVTYTNQGIQPQYQGNDYGVDMGYRLPVFDVEVDAEKDSPYSQLSQNELALQFYSNGFFNPQYADQALATIDMMQFQGKAEVIQKIQQNGTMYQQMLEMQQQMLQMGQMIDSLTGQSTIADSLATSINGQQERTAGAIASGAKTDINTGLTEEGSIMTNARQRAAQTTQPR